MLSAGAWWLLRTPVDLRCGADRLLVQVRTVLGGEPAEGAAYVFVNRAGTRIKVVSCDRHGVWLAVRRLHRGRFVWPRVGEASWTLSAEQFGWLCMGIDWQRLSIPPSTYGQTL